MFKNCDRGKKQIKLFLQLKAYNNNTYARQSHKRLWGDERTPDDTFYTNFKPNVQNIKYLKL